MIIFSQCVWIKLSPVRVAPTPLKNPLSPSSNLVDTPKDPKDRVGTPLMRKSPGTGTGSEMDTSEDDLDVDAEKDDLLVDNNRLKV